MVFIAALSFKDFYNILLSVNESSACYKMTGSGVIYDFPLIFTYL